MKFCTRILSGLFGALCVAFAAQAAPLQWTLNDVTFDDGGTASGSFVYDAAADAYSSINITTTPGTTVTTGSTYQYACTGAGTESVVCTLAPPTSTRTVLFSATPSSDLSGKMALALFFSAPLTDAGGTRNLDVASLAFAEATCFSPDCFSLMDPMRGITGGTITASPPAPATIAPVPTMGEWSLMAMALLMLGMGLRGHRLAGRR